jgi:hypothetical protein
MRGAVVAAVLACACGNSREHDPPGPAPTPRPAVAAKPAPPPDAACAKVPTDEGDPMTMDLDGDGEADAIEPHACNGVDCELDVYLIVHGCARAIGSIDGDPFADEDELATLPVRSHGVAVLRGTVHDTTDEYERLFAYDGKAGWTQIYDGQWSRSDDPHSHEAPTYTGDFTAAAKTACLTAASTRVSWPCKRTYRHACGTLVLAQHGDCMVPVRWERARR